MRMRVAFIDTRKQNLCVFALNSVVTSSHSLSRILKQSVCVVIVVCTDRQPDSAQIGGPGLVSGHAYTLIAVQQLSSGARLLKLRNPWGRFEWNGDWSDKSALWT